jgi:glycosyltransferase involved in cell wall biosynthesis
MTHGSGVPLLRRIRNDPMVNGLIVHLSDVGDRDLAWYYDNCLFTIYPSQYEGWGLPVGESLAAGRYCIASNAASLTEAGDSWIDYFDPDDFNACFELADRAIARPEYVRQREECLRVGYRAQTWHSSATQVSEIIDELESSAHRSIRQTP